MQSCYKVKKSQIHSKLSQMDQIPVMITSKASLLSILLKDLSNLLVAKIILFSSS